jgi:tetratricopeptide (TPR) repeat protein
VIAMMRLSAWSATSGRASQIPPLLLLGIFAVLAVSSMARMSVTGDEVTHLPAGYTYVTTGDFRLNMQHPPLMKVLAALPLLALDLKPATESRAFLRDREWRFGRDFLTDNRTPMRRIVFLARLPMVAVGLLAGAVLFLWASELWGYWPGIFVLFLYAFSPNFLAHSAVVHTDVGVSCFTLLTMYLLWKFTRTGRLRWALACGVGLGLALLAKYSGAVTALMVPATLAAWLVLGDEDGYGSVTGQQSPVTSHQSPITPLSLTWWDRIDLSRLPGLAAVGVLIALPAAALVAFGFGFPHGLSNYYRGFTLIHADANPYWQGFLWGQYADTGFWYYYVLGQVWKTPLPALLCFLFALFLVRPDESVSRLDWWFVLFPFAAFHAAAMWKHPSIGMRHVLPAFLFLFLAAGATARWVGRRGAGWKAALAALCLWQAIGTLRIYPYFIPYFNELAGGPGDGMLYLDDSNIEWGQEWYGLKQYLDAHRPATARILAFEPIGRRHYGITAEPIVLPDTVWPKPGVTYFVGASYLQRSSLFNEHPGVRFHWLERYRPVDQVGWSIYVYRFSVDPADRGDPSVFYIPRRRWYAQAIASLTGILSRSPGFAYASDTLADVYADRAAWRRDHGEEEAALLDDLRAVRSAPANARHRAAFRDDVTRLAASIAVDESLPAGRYYERAFEASDEKRGGEALLDLLRCQRRDPRHLGAHFNLGQTYARLGFLGLARAEWRRCLEIEPGYAPALQSLRAAEKVEAAARQRGR